MVGPRLDAQSMFRSLRLQRDFILKVVKNQASRS